MDQLNNQEYYSARAVTSRDLAQRATDPSIAAIHAEFAIRYEHLAVQLEQSGCGISGLVQAT